MTWYPIIFVLSIFLILVVVIRRALYLGPFVHGENTAERYLKSNESSLTGNDDEGKWRKGEKLFDEKKYFAAEKLYKDIVYSNSENDKAWARLGAIALTQKRYEDAAESFERSVEINPGVISRYYNLALSYYLIGNKDHASASIEVALKESPDKENYLTLKKKIDKM